VIAPGFGNPQHPGEADELNVELDLPSSDGPVELRIGRVQREVKRWERLAREDVPEAPLEVPRSYLCQHQWTPHSSNSAGMEGVFRESTNADSTAAYIGTAVTAATAHAPQTNVSPPERRCPR
ncbi:MAG: hypothetical protein VCB26_00730, partial [Candidatus Hydrogenedentota bacterium]